MQLTDLLYVGLNGRVAALDRHSGDIVWEWRAKEGSTYVTILPDRGQLFVSVDGYTYCLDPATGEEYWMNPLKGYSTGPTSLATVETRTPDLLQRQAAAQAAAAAATTATT
jgi:outer membrane protein assembly factor BamB